MADHRHMARSSYGVDEVKLLVAASKIRKALAVLFALAALALPWLCNTPAASADGVIHTNTWVDFVSTASTYHGQLVPVGAYIAIYDPQGVQCGEYTVTNAGQFPVTPCYGDDLKTPTVDEGASPGDVLTFKINGNTAKTEVIAIDGNPAPANTGVTWSHVLWLLNLHVLHDTSVDLRSSVNPSVLGQTVTFTATVSGVPTEAGTPSGTVTFKDGATIFDNIALTSGVATFTTSSLALGSHSMTAEYTGDAAFNPNTAELTQEVRSYEEKCGLTTATYDFTASGPVRVVITGLGTLHCLRVTHVTASHPQALPNIATGQYWTIAGLDSLGGSAGEFNVTLTLPTNFVPDANDKVCRYTDTAQIWDCASSGFDAAKQTVSRADVTQFSDWAVGNNVGPNAVTLAELRATSPGAWGGIGLCLAGLAGLVAGSVLYGRPSRS